MRFISSLRALGRPVVLSVCLMLTLVIGLADCATGHDLAFSLFYVFPITLATHGASRRFGLAIAILSTVAWLMADIADGHQYADALIYLWNSGIRFGFFVVIVQLQSALQRSLAHEQALARTDPLTGAANTRYFRELLQYEVSRSHRYRHPFSLVYLDIDNFKGLNDRLGHASGDAALCAIVAFGRQNLRQADVLARLGGDEFALLLPETNLAGARSLVAKMRTGLLQLAQSHEWPISFSLGVVVCEGASCPPDQIIPLADRLMYAAKHGGKNAAVFFTTADSITEPSVDPRAVLKAKTS